jgi:hypothetical protein
MEEITFNSITKFIHLKPCRYIITRKDTDYKKEKEVNKLTFYKDYKSKMIWFSGYGLGIENNKYFKINEKHFKIETEKTEINFYLI